MVSCDFLKVVFTVVSFYIFSWGYWLSHVDTVVAKGWWWGCQFQDHWAIDAWRIFDGWYGCANIKMGHTTIEMAILITLIGTMWKNCDWPVDCFRQSHMVWYTPCMCCLLYTWFCRSRMCACVCVCWNWVHEAITLVFIAINSIPPHHHDHDDDDDDHHHHHQ